MPRIGDVVGPITIGPVAHGGHCVAHHDGLVMFVRHTIPDEVVMATITGVTSSILRADATQILQSSPDRVAPACPIAAPGGCGGCDFAHVAVPRQRELKARVVADQLRRLAGIDWDGEVEPVVGDVDGWGWRTRMRYLLSGDRVGMRVHRSHRFIELPPAGCLLASPSLRRPRVEDGVVETVKATRHRRGRHSAQHRELLVVADSDGRMLPVGQPREVSVGQRRFTLGGDNFWQVHPGAAEQLAAAVVEGLSPQAGESALDLFCGAGLFAGVLAERQVRVTGVEGSPSALEWARVNVPEADFRRGDVAQVLPELPETDLVVMDPPRAGAGKTLMRAVVDRGPRAVAYVACDPASLGRDLAEVGQDYTVSSVRAFDVFPMTQHVECVAIIQPRT